MTSVKITSYVDELQRRQDELNDAKHYQIAEEADRANRRLDRGVFGAEQARPGTLFRDLGDINEPPPSTHPPTPGGLQLQVDWLNKHIVVLGEVVLALVSGHATRPREGE